METQRLKNIAIVILLLLNACLLLLLGYQHFQSRWAQADAREELRSLYAANQLTLSAQADLDQEPLSPLSLLRHSGTEQAIASSLLGGSTSALSQGGGIYSYAGEHGTIRFRSGGGFDGTGLTVPVEDIPRFFRQFCQTFGYAGAQVQAEGGAGTASAVQEVAGAPASGCAVSMEFEDGLLTAVTGAHVSLEDALPESAEQLGCITALVRFLDYRNASGTACSEVRSIRCIYELPGGAGALRLVPMWQVETDTYTYFIDCSNGEVTRR